MNEIQNSRVWHTNMSIKFNLKSSLYQVMSACQTEDQHLYFTVKLYPHTCFYLSWMNSAKKLITNYVTLLVTPRPESTGHSWLYL